MNHIKALANGFGEKGEKLVNIASMLKWEGELFGRGRNIQSKKYGHIKKEGEDNIKTDINKNEGWPTD